MKHFSFANIMYVAGIIAIAGIVLHFAEVKFMASRLNQLNTFAFVATIVTIIAAYRYTRS
jgi:uncharacterized membrane protein